MNKNQLQGQLDAAQKRINELSAENATLKQQVEGLEIQLQNMTKDSQSVAQKNATTPVNAVEKIPEDLVNAVELSCKDHCPHHRNPDACVNCGIGKILAKYKLPNTAWPRA